MSSVGPSSATPAQAARTLQLVEASGVLGMAAPLWRPTASAVALVAYCGPTPRPISRMISGGSSSAPTTNCGWDSGSGAATSHPNSTRAQVHEEELRARGCVALRHPDHVRRQPGTAPGYKCALCKATRLPCAVVRCPPPPRGTPCDIPSHKTPLGRLHEPRAGRGLALKGHSQTASPPRVMCVRFRRRPRRRR